MNFFICNRYDSKKEDIHIITPNIPIDKNRISYYNYDPLKNLKKLKHNLSISENEKNLSQEMDDTDELQIIEYPYQPKQTNYVLNTFRSNKSKESNSFINNSNIGYFNCFNNPKNNESFYGKKVINDFHKMKHSFSCLSNTILDDTTNNKIKNRNCNENLDLFIDDTIKGEDNMNLSKLKLRHNFKTKRNINNLKHIPNRIINKNKLNFKSKLIKFGDLKINKLTSENDFNITKNIIITETNRKINKNTSNNSNKKSYKSTINNIFSNKKNYFFKNKKISKNKESNLITEYKPINCYYNLRDNKSKNNKNRYYIHKNFSTNNFLINGYKDKIENNNKIINDSKNIIEAIKRKIKNDLFNRNIPKIEKKNKNRK